MTETPKSSNIIEIPGATKATIESEKVHRSERTDHCNNLIAEAGKLLETEGFKYVGSATVHYYEKPELAGTKYFSFATQLQISGIPDEGFVSKGFDFLRKRLMEAWGRKDRRVGEIPETWKG